MEPSLVVAPSEPVHQVIDKYGYARETSRYAVVELDEAGSIVASSATVAVCVLIRELMSGLCDGRFAETLDEGIEKLSQAQALVRQSDHESASMGRSPCERVPALALVTVTVAALPGSDMQLPWGPRIEIVEV